MRHDIVVIGGSAGAMQPLKLVLDTLPRELRAAVFIVLHRPSYSTDGLAEILGRTSSLPVSGAVDGAALEFGTVRVAPPDRHLIIKTDQVRLMRSPRENLWRPSIDVLFRSAAVAFGARVAGVVLSGALDDGSAGLAAIKRCGGLAIVQDPTDAQTADMPASALRATEVDHVAPAAALASVIERVVAQAAGRSPEIPETLMLEAQIAETGRSSEELQQTLGELTALTCPDCGGPLWKQKDAGLRFRCLTGHAVTARSLEAGLGESLDAALWAAIRQFEQRANLQSKMAQEEERRGRPHVAGSHSDRASEAHSHADVLRRLLLQGLGGHSKSAA